MHKLGGFFAKPRPFLPGDFVTTDQGTGLVHMAPDHGEDDFELCQAHGIDPVFAVDAGGFYRADWPWLGGQGSVINNKFNAPDGPINSDLREAGALLAAGEFQHSYPHSWRSKAKVIYRCTPQWFIAMDKPLPHFRADPRATGGRMRGAAPNPAALRTPHGPTLRQLAMQGDRRHALRAGERPQPARLDGRAATRLGDQPPAGLGRSDRLVRREKDGRAAGRPRGQRAHRRGHPRARASTPGTPRMPPRFLGPTATPKIMRGSPTSSTSGSTADRPTPSCWRAGTGPTSAGRPTSTSKAPTSTAAGSSRRCWRAAGRADGRRYNALLTHGFTMDSKGMKMSKSLGNTVSPIDLMKEYGADILRLWALSVDFTEDHRIGKEILAGVADQYRKLRNTFRYLLGALDGFSEEERLDDVAAYPELERYMLHLTAELDQKLRNAVDDFDFNTYVRALTDFCNEDLSAFYFDIRKDSLYCDAPARRSGGRTGRCSTPCSTRWCAGSRPVLVFTSEEVWGTRYPDAGSVHLLEWPRACRRSTPTKARVGATLRDASRPGDRADRAAAPRQGRRIEPRGRSLRCRATRTRHSSQELFITSTVHSGDWKVVKTDNHKCARCWRHRPDVDAASDSTPAATRW